MLFGLTDYLPEAVLTVGDNLEFLIRILVVELFGFLIGLERSKRQKDAGIRTHCIIAVTSAVIMILSKYCFVDLVDLGIAGRNSDPGRMTTQVVSGIVGSDVGISLEGLLMGLASELCYGGYTIFTHYGMRYCDSFTMAYWTFLIAGIASLFLADGPALLSALAEPRTGLAALGLMVMGTALPFTLYTKGLETVESGKAAIIANIEPVMSAVIGVTVFQETLGLWTLVGIVLVLSGVVVLACEKEPDK